MVWFKVHSDFAFSVPALEAGNRAIGLWTLAGTWCARHSPDFEVPREVVSYLGGQQRDVQRLIAAQLWTTIPTGWKFRRNDQIWITSGDQASRPTISRELRGQVLARDHHACLHCGATSDLQMDHIYPWSLGGATTFENLQTLCGPCNRLKGARVDA